MYGAQKGFPPKKMATKTSPGFLAKTFGHLGMIPLNVNPGLINPKRLFNWEGTIKKSIIL